jgi:hypothetical protein
MASTEFQLSARVESALDALSAMPEAIDRARNRAARGLVRWVKSQIIRTLAREVGVKSPVWRKKARVYATPTRSGNVSIWIGTDPFSITHLGKLKWDRYRGAGSRPANKPRSPSPQAGVTLTRSKTKQTRLYRGAFTARTSRGDTVAYERDPVGKPIRGRTGAKHREGIRHVTDDVHQDVINTAQRIMLPSIDERWLFEVDRALRAELFKAGAFATDLADMDLA